MKFDTPAFLKSNFGSAEDTVLFLHKHGVKNVPLASAVQWFRRGSVPSRWLVVLLALKEIERGAPLPVAPYYEVR